MLVPNRCFRVLVFWGRLEVQLFDEREETKEEGERMHLRGRRRGKEKQEEVTGTGHGTFQIGRDSGVLSNRTVVGAVLSEVLWK